MAFVPVIDGDLIPAHPMAAIAAGAGAEVPLLTGTTSEEYRLFLFPTGLGALITDEILSGLLPALGVGAPVAGLYRSNRPGATPGDIMAALVTDKFFRLPALAVAEARTSGAAPTYVYEFAWQSPVGDLGACHSLEIPFVFDNLSASGAALVIGEDRPQHLASQMHTAWIRFARDGDPGWRAFDKDYPVRIFGAAGPAAEAVETVELDPRGDERRIWSNPSPEVA
jgi:para-nitrobenzyl esterase